MSTPLICAKVIYIMCPENKVTGGTEALHQLRYYLEMAGHTAYISYYDSNGKYVDGIIPERYQQYFGKNKMVINGSNILDQMDSCVVVPEFSTYLLWNIKHASCVVWWLSVRYYDGGSFMRNISIKHWIKQSLTRPSRLLHYKDYYNPYNLHKTVHLCASEYAYQYVTQSLNQVAYRMIEPISKDFLLIGPETKMVENRKDIVAYNPAKPSAIMDKLIKRGQFEFVPIQGMTPCQIAELFQNIKLYIDFGEFPGPERLPKEAVYNGTEIIVGKRNAACNNFDINIPEKYKIQEYNDIEIVSNKINEMLKQYNNYYHDFDVFRKQIQSLENNFLKSIQMVWG